MAKKELDVKAVTIQADDLISFRQLSKKATGGDADDVGVCLHDQETVAELLLQFDDVVKATGAGVVQDDFVSKLSRITQLTGG